MPATYEPIATTTLGSAAASITFSSIPSTYTDLRLVFTGKNATTGTNWIMQVNGDTSGGSVNYSSIRLSGSGAAITSGRLTNTYRFIVGDVLLNNSDTTPSMTTVDVFSYANASINKTFLYNFYGDTNGSGTVISTVGLWRNTNAITTILFKNENGSNLAAGFTATIYGIKAA